MMMLARRLFARPAGISRARAALAPRSLSSSASSSELVKITYFDEARTAQISLAGPPANSLGLEMLRAITASIETVEASGRARGFVLSSESATIFSAGLELTELSLETTTVERLPLFWGALQDVFLALYGTPLAAVAAIDGHAPAGGCLLASACDERVMARGKFGIGLNETQLGIVAPWWFVPSHTQLMGPRATSRMLQLGTLFKPEEALANGLVDQLEDHGSVVAAAHEVLGAYVRINPEARAASKMIHRLPVLEQLREGKQKDIDEWVEYVQTAPVQESVGAYLASLKKRKK